MGEEHFKIQNRFFLCESVIIKSNKTKENCSREETEVKKANYRLYLQTTPSPAETAKRNKKNKQVRSII